MSGTIMAYGRSESRGCRGRNLGIEEGSKMSATSMVKAIALIAMLAGITAAQVKYVVVVETEVDAQSGVAAKISI
jgi:hypothetical protein